MHDRDREQRAACLQSIMLAAGNAQMLFLDQHLITSGCNEQPFPREFAFDEPVRERA